MTHPPLRSSLPPTKSQTPYGDPYAPREDALSLPTQAEDLTRFEPFLAGILPSFLSRTDGLCPKPLQESIRYSLLAPGKRIRPRLALATSALLQLPLGASLSVACAIEMVHCYTLIHDDLPCLDNDDFRRGQPSNHKKFGEATALLAGDALQAIAMETLLAAASWLPDPARVILAARRLCWAMGPRGVIAGQVAETELHEKSTREELEQVHRGKTGALFMASILIPRDLCGAAPSSALQILEPYAEAIGQAFQVVDDLEDAPQDQVRAPYTSILRHLSSQAASDETVLLLQNAQKNLWDEWGPQAQLLSSFADELIARVQRFAHRS